MIKKITTITILVMSILLVSLYVISSTYSVIINVTSKDNGEESIGELTIRDIVTDENGYYNETYYDVKRELNIDANECEYLIDSIELNTALNTIIKDVVNYKLHHHDRMTSDHIYRLIVESVNRDDNINNEIKQNVIAKTSIYLNDIINYIYEFNISTLGELS